MQITHQHLKDFFHSGVWADSQTPPAAEKCVFSSLGCGMQFFTKSLLLAHERDIDAHRSLLQQAAEEQRNLREQLAKVEAELIGSKKKRMNDEVQD